MRKHLEGVHPDAFFDARRLENLLTDMNDNYKMVIDVICRNNECLIKEMK